MGGGLVEEEVALEDQDPGGGISAGRGAEAVTVSVCGRTS